MAQIPIGGQMTSIDVSSLALEATQRDVLMQSQKATDALQSIAASMGVALQKDNQVVKSNKEISSEISALSGRDKGMVETFRKGVNLSNSAVESLKDITGKEKLSETTGGMLTGLGLGALGAGLGSVFGLMEEYGASLAALRRTGGGLAVNLVELRSAAANVGIGMETLSKITTENGPAIRSLGSNMRNGTNEFLRLTQELRNSTKEMGFFGMGANEMGALLIDELEIRRQMSTQGIFEGQARENLVNSMKENLKLNEVMAGLNGQDVQDRIKARNDFRRNAVVAAASRNMSVEQIAAQKSAIEGLSAMGNTATPIVQKALENLISNIPMDNANTAFTQLAAAAQENGIDLRSALMNVQSDIMSGMDPKEIGDTVQALTNSFKQADVSSGFISRASAGQEGALLFLTTQQEAFGTAAEGMAAQAAASSDAMQQFNNQIGSAMAASGFANQMSVAGEQIRAQMISSMTNTLGLAPGGNFANFMDRLAAFPNSSGFENTLDFIVSTTAFASGTMGALKLLNISEDMNGLAGAQQDASVLAFTASVGAAAGNAFAAKALSFLTTMNGVAEAGEFAIKMGQEFDLTRETAAKLETAFVNLGYSYDNLVSFLKGAGSGLLVSITNWSDAPDPPAPPPRVGPQ
tara:strand:+ start:2177 stop:4087 length:1911 start_codon:yes stop_codon:yes gene_type:complete